MVDKQDLMSGIHYLEMSSKPREAEEPESTFGEGLMIAVGFMAMFVLMFAVA